MGLLDEAIREHLELKRRRGADPTEVERLEREALGPARRVQQEASTPYASDLADVAGEELPVDGIDHGEQDPVHEDEFASEPGYEAPPDHDDEYEPEAPELSQTAPEPPAEAPEAHGVVPPPASGEPGEPGPSNRPVYEDPGVETAEYDVEAEHAEENDVLEETPEFLQDTPDHDRLWFEQRPPKDFDFEG